MLRTKKVVNRRIDLQQHNTQDTRVTTESLPPRQERKAEKYAWILKWMKRLVIRQFFEMLWENRLEIWGHVLVLWDMVFGVIAP